MAQQTERQAEILRYLWSEDNRGLTAMALAAEFGASDKSTRHTLRRLEAEGLTRREHGQSETRSPHEALKSFGGKDIRRTPDTWYATDAGLKLAAELVEVTDEPSQG